MSKIKVLIFPAGKINSIELHDALSSNVHIEVWGAASIERHGQYVFKNYIPNLPMMDKPDFIQKLNEVIAEKNINIIFPTHDTAAEFLAEHQSEINAKIIVADSRTTEICRDKEKTYELFAKEDFCPKIYNKIETFPVFIKPKKGQGTHGTRLIKKPEDIPQNINWDDYVICEHLSGEEYTVDCFTDKYRTVFAFPRSRDRVLGGVSVAGQNEPLTDEIKYIAEEINKKLNLKGLWYFQIKKNDEGKFKLLEISTRAAGSMCLTRALGVNLPLLSVYNAMDYDVEIMQNDYAVTMDRTLISRYKIDYEYDKVYFDFDDTIVIDGQVNLNAIRFLYQCKNKKKEVILITRHEYDLTATFEKYSISKKLFDKIYHIGFDEEKGEYVNPDRAIYIDNSVSERRLVQSEYNIPVFDVDGIEVLLDWRS